MDFQVGDDELDGFNEEAKSQVCTSMEGIYKELIQESYRIESSQNPKGNPEVTSVIVRDAESFLRKGLNKPSQPWYKVILKILSYILPVSLGIMWNPESMKDQAYLFSFLALGAFTLITITVLIIKE